MLLGDLLLLVVLLLVVTFRVVLGALADVISVVLVVVFAAFAALLVLPWAAGSSEDGSGDGGSGSRHPTAGLGLCRGPSGLAVAPLHPIPLSIGAAASAAAAAAPVLLLLQLLLLFAGEEDSGSAGAVRIAPCEGRSQSFPSGSSGWRRRGGCGGHGGLLDKRDTSQTGCSSNKLGARSRSFEGSPRFEASRKLRRSRRRHRSFSGGGLQRLGV
mmetsp:Transcript_19452/g.29116  ORF Transcript_19452/g.29116 Transcript_19452/m.29116 type:complete len:214 (-) Transcript_19452:104-745(-)